MKSGQKRDKAVEAMDAPGCPRLSLPRIVFGSSALGNLYGVVKDATKQAIVDEWIARQRPLTVIDSAGKYGAGLALETIGRCLAASGVPPEQVCISNKLGWRRVALQGKEPGFEPGVWFGLEHDAEQAIGYEAILDCWEQGNRLLGDYEAQLVSVHDPDEYLAGAESPEARSDRYGDILEAYRALEELRESGRVQGVGVGAKDWTIIRRLHGDGVRLDWVMFANRFTLYRHPPEVLDFMEALGREGITVVNSAVFNAGFLIGGHYFDYAPVTEADRPELFAWRDAFFEVCERFAVSPARACCQFALSPPEVHSLALNTSRPERVAENVEMVETSIAPEFWEALKEKGLLEEHYRYL